MSDCHNPMPDLNDPHFAFQFEALAEYARVEIGEVIKQRATQGHDEMGMPMHIALWAVTSGLATALGQCLGILSEAGMDVDVLRPAVHGQIEEGRAPTADDAGGA